MTPFLCQYRGCVHLVYLGIKYRTSRRYGRLLFRLVPPDLPSDGKTLDVHTVDSEAEFTQRRRRLANSLLFVTFLIFPLHPTRLLEFPLMLWSKT